MEHTKIPPMNFDDANLSWKYKQWELNMKLLLEGPLVDKTDKQKVAYFFINIGQQGRDIFNTWELTDAEKTIGNLFEKFKLYCTPKKRLTTLRLRFNSLQQAESETIDQFVTALKLLAEGCEFGDLQPSLIRDRVICGTKECSIKERLLQEDDPTLEEALKIARSLEASKLDLSSMETAVRVHAVKLTIHAGVGMWVVPGIRTRIQIARSLVTIHAEIRTRVAPGQGESPKFPRQCHQSSRGRGIP
ncbi:hypothetical protein ElyMa_003989300 [Elysia marginata]|uniref:Retrotransposon gag domain-containing protein n=1 Tax=Elysia marginata TaxID=1093978 RepID=A0AAV4FZC9_9GAST|nr:hypothetical protein ElyMa_003989300 [Elysia marginata]